MAVICQKISGLDLRGGEQTMSKNLKAMLFSENGMKIVNTLFLITAFCGGGGGVAAGLAGDGAVSNLRKS